jgi:hypothetical protein
VKASFIFAPVFIVVMILVLVLPRLGRIQSPPAEILPSTSLQPTAEYDSVFVSSSAASIILEAAPANRTNFSQVEKFAAPLLNGISEDVVGVFLPGLFALPVMQQPKDQPAYVSSANDLLTQFSLPKQYNTVGLLAHNYLSGSLFYDIDFDQTVVVINGDGSTQQYRIERIERFQALNPTSPYSSFVDQADPSGKVLTSAELFSRIYTVKNKLIFQTCIDAEGDPSWGRIFIIAKPIDGFQNKLHLIGQYTYEN